MENRSEEEYKKKVEDISPKLVEMYNSGAFNIEVKDVGEGKLEFTRKNIPLVFNQEDIDSMILYINSYYLMVKDERREEGS